MNDKVTIEDVQRAAEAINPQSVLDAISGKAEYPDRETAISNLRKWLETPECFADQSAMALAESVWGWM